MCDLGEFEHEIMVSKSDFDRRVQDMDFINSPINNDICDNCGRFISEQMSEVTINCQSCNDTKNDICSFGSKISWMNL